MTKAPITGKQYQTNKAIRKLKVLDKKRQAEDALRKWIQKTPSEREKLLHLMSSLELNYKDRKEVNRAMAYFGESFINSSPNWCNLR